MHPITRPPCQTGVRESCKTKGSIGVSVTKWLGLLRSVVIYHNPVRTRPLRDFYRGFLGPNDLAFDIGAHVGNRSRAMRAAGARVVALEPQALFARFLRLTLPRDIRRYPRSRPGLCRTLAPRRGLSMSVGTAASRCRSPRLTA